MGPYPQSVALDQNTKHFPNNNENKEKQNNNGSSITARRWSHIPSQLPLTQGRAESSVTECENDPSSLCLSDPFHKQKKNRDEKQQKNTTEKVRAGCVVTHPPYSKLEHDLAATATETKERETREGDSYSEDCRMLPID